MYIIDVEASGLAAESYPIEIAWLDSEDPDSFDSFLIVPDPTWIHWDEYAENEIHHISRAMLEEDGITLEEACERLNFKLSGKEVYSDAVDFDRNWIQRLFNTVSVEPTFKVRSIFDLLPENAEQDYDALVFDQVVVHRALDDARQIASMVAKLRITLPKA